MKKVCPMFVNRIIIRWGRKFASITIVFNIIAILLLGGKSYNQLDYQFCMILFHWRLPSCETSVHCLFNSSAVGGTSLQVALQTCALEMSALVYGKMSDRVFFLCSGLLPLSCSPVEQLAYILKIYEVWTSTILVIVIFLIDLKAFSDNLDKVYMVLKWLRFYQCRSLQ